MAMQLIMPIIYTWVAVGFISPSKHKVRVKQTEKEENLEGVRGCNEREIYLLQRNRYKILLL